MIRFFKKDLNLCSLFRKLILTFPNAPKNGRSGNFERQHCSARGFGRLRRAGADATAFVVSMQIAETNVPIISNGYFTFKILVV